MIRCDHGSAVPGAYVYYTEWPTAADARRWQADIASGGPGLDDTATGVDGAGTPPGPRHTGRAADGTVYTTVAYADRPYSDDMVTRSPDDSRRLVPAMRLLAAARIPA